MKQIIRQAKEINEIAKEKGWWKNGRSNDTIFMLVITELAEAIEADRDGNYGNLESFNEMVTNLTFKNCFDAYLKGCVGVELADAYIRILDYLYYRNGEYFSIPEFEIDFSDTFSDNVFNICRKICDYEVTTALFMIMKLCEHMDIDLNTFVELKIQYNKGREYKHGGKKY